MAITARGAALKALERCRRDQAFSDSLLISVLDGSGLSPRDRALVARLCYGVLQNKILLDFYIARFCGGERKLEPKVRDILRISLYQILLLDRVPDHAAVSEGVELCKVSGFTRAAGLVNAVLRRAVRSKDALPEIPDDNFEEYLSIKYSTPRPLVKTFIQEFGGEFAEDFLRENNSVPPMTIQVNTLKTTAEELTSRFEAEGVVCQRHEFLPDALNIEQARDVFTLSAFGEGLFFVQDAAAMLAVRAAAPAPGARVLDACAAPGGKSFAAAMLMKNTGEILSCDIHENKLGRVAKGAKALGIDIIRTQKCDAAEQSEELRNAFDLVIADVPCSGLGVIRKKPDIRYKDISELANLPELQLRILENISSYVKPGGTLLYSTCTVLRRENEAVVRAFMERHPQFALESFELPAPVGRADSGMLTLYPHVHGTDGFFICKMRKCAGDYQSPEDLATG